MSRLQEVQLFTIADSDDKLTHAFAGFAYAFDVRHHIKICVWNNGGLKNILNAKHLHNITACDFTENKLITYHVLLMTSLSYC